LADTVLRISKALPDAARAFTEYHALSDRQHELPYRRAQPDRRDYSCSTSAASTMAVQIASTP
jgi:hypothetical protein